MDLLHRWGDCAGEWYPKRDGGQVYWICRACGIRYLNDEHVIRAAMGENRIGRTLRFLTESGTHLLRRERGA